MATIKCEICKQTIGEYLPTHYKMLHPEAWKKIKELWAQNEKRLQEREPQY